MADAPQTPPPVDPAELQRSLAEIAEKSAKVITELVEHQPQAGMMRDLEELGINKAFMELGAKLMSDPMKLAELQMRAWEDYSKLWGATLSKFLGDASKPVKEPAKGDNRFRNEVWQNNFVFDYIKQSYLIAADHIQRAVAEAQGLDANDARKVKFFTRQYVDALAPTNFVFTNPEVLKTTIDSGGKNLLEGLNHLLGDLERGKGKLTISMTDNSAFTMGENVATTPGKVVYQNDLMQLLQYAPATPQVDRTPLLITPPWINKYYILDLRAKNSFIKWAVDQGITVFVISWVNPDERHAQKTFDDYLFEGPLAATDAIARITGERSVNLIGYCLGGTLTACLLSWLQKKGQADRVKSVTFFTTMIDFQEPGELGVFVDDAIVDKLEKRMESRGYLEGSEMAGTFNMMRDNDLIWSFVVNNYLLGKDPFPFDLLYWNSDSTRMPAKMHTFYLRNMYIRNLLREKDALTVGGEKMDLSAVTTPAYFISAIEDHIAPLEVHLRRRTAPRRQGALRAGRLGPHRRHREPAGRAEVQLLDQRSAGRESRRLARRRSTPRQLLVERLGHLDSRVRRWPGETPHSGRRCATGAGRCARFLRQVPARCGRGWSQVRPGDADATQQPGRRGCTAASAHDDSRARCRTRRDLRAAARATGAEGEGRETGEGRRRGTQVRAESEIRSGGQAGSREDHRGRVAGGDHQRPLPGAASGGAGNEGCAAREEEQKVDAFAKGVRRAKPHSGGAAARAGVAGFPARPTSSPWLSGSTYARSARRSSRR